MRGQSSVIKHWEVLVGSHGMGTEGAEEAEEADSRGSWMGGNWGDMIIKTGLSLPWKPFWKKNYGDKRSGRGTGGGRGKIVGKGKIRSKGPIKLCERDWQGFRREKDQRSPQG